MHEAKKGFYLGYIFQRGLLLDHHNLICRDMDAISIYLMTQKRGLRLGERAFPQSQKQVVLA